jgi:excisionase family DNA binding protein
MSAQDDEILLGLNSAAEKLAVSRRTVVRAIEAGQLPSVKIGRRRLVRREALLTWLANKETVAA